MHGPELRYSVKCDNNIELLKSWYNLLWPSLSLSHSYKHNPLSHTCQINHLKHNRWDMKNATIFVCPFSVLLFSLDLNLIKVKKIGFKFTRIFLVPPDTYPPTSYQGFLCLDFCLHLVVYLCIIFYSIHSIFALPGWHHVSILRKRGVSYFGLILKIKGIAHRCLRAETRPLRSTDISEVLTIQLSDNKVVVVYLCFLWHH